MKLHVGFVVALTLSCAAWADDGENRAKLIGNWQAQNQGGEVSPQVWSLQRNGDTLRVIESRGDEKILEYECNTEGRECPIKVSGKPAKLSMWFNGSMLVAMEFRGSAVTERHFSVSGDGNTLQVDLIPLTPAGKTEVLHFDRSETSTARK